MSCFVVFTQPWNPGFDVAALPVFAAGASSLSRFRRLVSLILVATVVIRYSAINSDSSLVFDVILLLSRAMVYFIVGLKY